jgi:hypothetical protein
MCKLCKLTWENFFLFLRPCPLNITHLWQKKIKHLLHSPRSTLNPQLLEPQLTCCILDVATRPTLQKSKKIFYFKRKLVKTFFVCCLVQVFKNVLFAMFFGYNLNFNIFIHLLASIYCMTATYCLQYVSAASVADPDAFLFGSKTIPWP